MSSPASRLLRPTQGTFRPRKQYRSTPKNLPLLRGSTRTTETPNDQDVPLIEAHSPSAHPTKAGVAQWREHNVLRLNRRTSRTVCLLNLGCLEIRKMIQCMTTFRLTCGCARTIHQRNDSGRYVVLEGPYSICCCTTDCLAKHLTPLTKPSRKPRPITYTPHSATWASGLDTRNDVDLYTSDPCPEILDMTGYRCGAGRADIGSS